MDDAYLDLAMREYLGMRQEMNAQIRLEMSLILGSLAVVGGAAATVASGIGNIDLTARAFILQVVAAFGLVTFIIGIGVANTFLILEAYVTSAAAEIECLAGDGGARHLASMQRRMRVWTTKHSARNVVAWLISYGSTQILAAVALVMIAAIAVVGYAIPGSPDPLAEAAKNILGLTDAVLGASALVMLVTSLLFVGSWDDVMSGAPSTRATRRRRARPAE
ncbi:MAG TPA: hypothetical protein VJ850_08545 [Candidatus Limnocylindrales bacterium]|nr:hypothetical protein [Candidatus Limnocylindrales bacterium]